MYAPSVARARDDWARLRKREPVLGLESESGSGLVRCRGTRGGYGGVLSGSGDVGVSGWALEGSASDLMGAGTISGECAALTAATGVSVRSAGAGDRPVAMAVE